MRLILLLFTLLASTELLAAPMPVTSFSGRVENNFVPPQPTYLFPAPPPQPYISAQIANNAYDAQIYFQNANQHFANGNYTDAIADYNMAIEFDPDNYIYYHNRAVAWQKIGKIDAAIEDYNIAIELNPAEASIH